MNEFQNKIQVQFDKMCTTGKLFISSITGDLIWNAYLHSFGEDIIFRDPQSTIHNCKLCNNFIRRYGNIIALDSDLNIMTIFDIEIEGEYKAAAKDMSNLIKSGEIQDVFFETYQELNSLNYEKCKTTNHVFRLGIAKNAKRYTKEEAEKFGVVKPNEIVNFEHFYLDIPKAFVKNGTQSIESIRGDYRSSNDVFKRCMKEVSLDVLHIVRDLICQNSLLDGATHLFKVEAVIPLKNEYDKISDEKKSNWCWKNSYEFKYAKFKNELIGVLCSEISIGEKTLEQACLSWNKRVDPANYMKATAPITKQQITLAQKFVEENGYIESFDRRFATIDDIKASEILHLNSGNSKKVSIFDNVKSSAAKTQPDFKNIEELSIDKFMSDILPNCTSVEAYFANKHANNLVSLTTANVKESKPIFKWSNNYSWTFNGNLAGKSMIKEAVKTSGGKVDGVLRFSIMWAENDPTDRSDLDAHCIEPRENHIYFNRKLSSITGGNLDIDITDPERKDFKNIVENITWPSIDRMRNGVYKMYINQYCNRGSKGFKAEIEFDGQLYSYESNSPVTGNVMIADVTLNNGVFSIDHKFKAVSSEGISKDVYGISTNEFHKVNLICLSPNHWDDNIVGNKFYFFILEGCKTTSSIRSFHVENLTPELLEYRKVLEVLGTTTMIKPSDNQLSGLGFNATVNDELIVKIEGSFKRMLKIKF